MFCFEDGIAFSGESMIANTVQLSSPCLLIESLNDSEGRTRIVQSSAHLPTMTMFLVLPYQILTLYCQSLS